MVSMMETELLLCGKGIGIFLYSNVMLQKAGLMLLLVVPYAICNLLSIFGIKGSVYETFSIKIYKISMDKSVYKLTVNKSRIFNSDFLGLLFGVVCL